MELVFEKADEGDIPELTQVMTRAFDDDARKHFGVEKGGPPGYDDGEFFRKWMLGYEESIGHKVLFDGQIVGCVIVWILERGGDGINDTPDVHHSQLVVAVADDWCHTKAEGP